MRLPWPQDGRSIQMMSPAECQLVPELKRSRSTGITDTADRRSVHGAPFRVDGGVIRSTVTAELDQARPSAAGATTWSPGCAR